MSPSSWIVRDRLTHLTPSLGQIYFLCMLLKIKFIHRCLLGALKITFLSHATLTSGLAFFPNLVFPVIPCRSPLVWPTKRWNAKVLMTKAVWVTIPCPGACTGLGLASPSGTTGRKNCSAHRRPSVLGSIWTSMQGF